MGLALGTSTGRGGGSEGGVKRRWRQGRKRGVGEGLGKENVVICTISI